MNGNTRPHPAHVPTLTEIIDLQAPQSAPAPVDAAVAGARPPLSLDALPVLGEVVPQVADKAMPAPPASITAAPVTEAQLAHRVLCDVQKQVDSMLEFRLKEAMAPVLARHTEAIVRDLREELNRTLKDVVARSVAQELAKLRQR